jgi:hypothetical protein
VIVVQVKFILKVLASFERELIAKMLENRRYFCIRESTASKMIKKHPRRKNKNNFKNVKFLHFVSSPADRFEAVFFVMNDDRQERSISTNSREVVPQNIIWVVFAFRIALQIDTSAGE